MRAVAEARFPFIAAAVLVAGVASSGTAHADRRSFAHTYEYQTMPEGKTSLELWHTQNRWTSASNSPQLYEGMLEVEHGITEHWDIAIYQVFQQFQASTTAMNESLHLDEVKLETRYRFAERGDWPVDTLAYLELAKDFGQSLYEIEGKVIGARDFGDITVAGNAIVEIAVGKSAKETEPEVGWAVGAAYEAHPKVRVGAETWGTVEEEVVYASVGPAINLAPASNFWATLSFGFGVTDKARNEGAEAEHGFFSARLLMGIEL